MIKKKDEQRKFGDQPVQNSDGIDNSIEVFIQLQKEIAVDDYGVGSASKRGLARMCGYNNNPWRNNSGHFFNAKVDRMLASKGFDVVSKIVTEEGRVIDTVCALIIKFYARRNDVADRFLDAYLTVGIRSTFQKVKGWQAPSKYSSYILKEPRVWTKMFGDDFYDELSRLSGLSWDKKTHQKPCIFAQHTYDLVYFHLPSDVYEQIKELQQEHGGYIHRLHEFLSPEGLDALKTHLVLTMNILTATTSIEDAKQLVSQALTRNYQLNLFQQ